MSADGLKRVKRDASPMFTGDDEPKFSGQAAAFLMIPDELRRVRQWVVFRLQWKTQKDGTVKKTKVPFQTDGRKAATTRPNEWTTFDVAVAAPMTERVWEQSDDVNVGEGFSGIGFIFTTDSGYVGIDLDAIRNPETGDVEPWASQVIREMGSYTEVTQSGRGFHIIVRGSMPLAGNRKGRMEMYFSGRFFVMTGKVDPNVGSTSIRDVDLTSLHQRMLTGLNPKSKEKAKLSVVKDESGEDARIIRALFDRYGDNGDAIEDAVRKEHPERYSLQNEKHGDRGGVCYIRYSINRLTELFKQNLPPGAPAEVATGDEAFPPLPEGCLIGTIGDVVSACTRACLLPPQFLYLCLLTMFGSLAGPRLVLGLPPRQLSGRLYSILLGPGGSNKGTAIGLSEQILGVGEQQVIRRTAKGSKPERLPIIREGDGIHSGEGLIEDLRDLGGHTCYVWDEMGSFFDKGRIEGSSLFPKIKTLYYSTEASAKRSSRKGAGGRAVVNNVWLSLVGGLTKNKWETSWSGGSEEMFRRFSLAAVAKADRVPDVPTEMLQRIGQPLRAALQDLRIPQWTPAGKEALREWENTIAQDDTGAYQSIDENTDRAALILAASMGADIDDRVAQAAIVWGKYQAAIRSKFIPTDTVTYDAECEAQILRHLPAGQRMEWQLLYRSAHLERYGSGMAGRVRRSMVEEGRLVYRRPWTWKP